MKKLKKKQIFLIVSIILIIAIVYFFFLKKKKIAVNYISASERAGSGTEISVPSGVTAAVSKGKIVFNHPNYGKKTHAVTAFWINKKGTGDGGTIFIAEAYKGTGDPDRQEATVSI